MQSYEYNQYWNSLQFIDDVCNIQKAYIKNFMASDKSEYIKLFFLPPVGISNLDDPVQRYFLHYIFVPGIIHVN